MMVMLFIISFYFASVLRFSVLLAVKTCGVLPLSYWFLPLLFLVLLSWSWRPELCTLCCLDFARNNSMIALCLDKILRSTNSYIPSLSHLWLSHSSGFCWDIRSVKLLNSFLLPHFQLMCSHLSPEGSMEVHNHQFYTTEFIPSSFSQGPKVPSIFIKLTNFVSSMHSMSTFLHFAQRSLAIY